MKKMEIFEILTKISNISVSISELSNLRNLRKTASILNNINNNTFNNNLNKQFIKNAFDSRRIDQEIDINPRRGLQNYNRSEAFISTAMQNKLESLSKLRLSLNDLQNQYGKQSEWQDSNARILLSSIDKGLRTFIKDADYTENQNGVGSLNYLEELLHVRYRLTFEDLNIKNAAEIKKIILSKDPELTQPDINIIPKKDISNNSYDLLIEKLFGNIDKDTERTVTIIIKDKSL